jgi:hypothetical protein
MVDKRATKVHSTSVTKSPTPDVLLKATLVADVITVSARVALGIEGQGAPEGESFQRSVAALYGVAYTLKFARKGSGRGDFKIGALEGCWGIDGPEAAFVSTPRSEWRWRLRLTVPADVRTAEVTAAIAAATTKKSGKLEGSAEAARVELERIPAQRWGRVLHIGPYAHEAASVAKARAAIEAAGQVVGRGHVEIYLGDPRRTKPEKLRTVLLVGVASQSGRNASSSESRAPTAATKAVRASARKSRRLGVTIRLVLLAMAMAPAMARAQPAAQPTPPPVVTVPATEQPRTLLARPIHSGGYGAPVVSYTRFAGTDSLLVGGRGGWVVNHQLVIGGGGFGLATPPRQTVGVAPDQTEYQHTFGYGGLWLEYLIAPMSAVHASAGTLIGAGRITYQRFRPDTHNVDQTSVFVLDPVLAVEVNVTTFLRFAVQSGYRVVRGVDLATLHNSDASGFTLGGAFKFGRF